MKLAVAVAFFASLSALAGQHDVGVIRDLYSPCPPGSEEIIISTDDEDGDDNSFFCYFPAFPFAKITKPPYFGVPYGVFARPEPGAPWLATGYVFTDDEDDGQYSEDWNDDKTFDLSHRGQSSAPPRRARIVPRPQHELVSRRRCRRARAAVVGDVGPRDHLLRNQEPSVVVALHPRGRHQAHRHVPPSDVEGRLVAVSAAFHLPDPDRDLLPLPVAPQHRVDEEHWMSRHFGGFRA